MRLTPPRVVYCLGLVTLLYLFVIIFASENEKPKRCDLSHEYQETLEETIGKVHKVLKKIGITHLLCYDTLVGQIRLGSNLPWEDSGYFCVFNEDLLKFDESYIGKEFQKIGLKIHYDSADGRYLVTRPDKQVAGMVKLVVFSKEGELQDVIEPTYYRIGWKRRLLPPNCDYSPSLQCFPARLVDSPLKMVQFGSLGKIPAPHEHFEILKYHFPDSWWKDPKPSHC